MRLFAVTTLVLLAQVALAAEGEHAGAHHLTVPTTELFWQVFNLSILIAALVYFLRQPVKGFFAGRQSGFLASAEKSQAAKQAAQKQYLEMKGKLDHLEDTKDESLARAQAEAVDLRKQLVREAEEMAARIRKEAETTTQMEILRARQELQRQFAEDAISQARMVLTKDIGAADQQKLQTDFIKNIQAVNP